MLSQNIIRYPSGGIIKQRSFSLFVLCVPYLTFHPNSPNCQHKLLKKTASCSQIRLQWKNLTRANFISIVDEKLTRSPSKRIQNIDVHDDDSSNHDDGIVIKSIMIKDELDQNLHDCPSEASLAIVGAYLAESEGRPGEVQQFWKTLQN